MHRHLHRLNAALLVLLFAGSLWTWSDLPAQIPVHFDGSGTADRYAEATLMQWLLLPFIALAVAGTLYAMAWWIGRNVGDLNVPDQDAFDALSESEQRQVATLPLGYLYGLAAAILALFGTMQAATYQTAVYGDGAMHAYRTVATVVVLAGILAGTVWLMVALRRRIRRLSRDGGEWPSDREGRR